ncbi:NAD(P)-binding Rossmann-fold superfamily protein, partial [Prunus dulcis]
MATIAKVQNHYYNGKRRQICRKHSTIREFLSNGAVRVDYVRSDENLADPLTKGLAREKVWKTTKGMGLKPLEESARREKVSEQHRKVFVFGSFLSARKNLDRGDSGAVLSWDVVAFLELLALIGQSRETDRLCMRLIPRIVHSFTTNFSVPFQQQNPQFQKFFPAQKTNKIRKEILGFTQKEGEVFHECWERYKEM